MDPTRTLSVSEFNRFVSDYLAQGLGTVTVQGEVSGYRVARDQLIYFDLKDEKARCLCFALKWDITQPLEDGMEVKVAGVPKLFQGSGGFHLRVQDVALVGTGALQKAFEKLKKKLETEGLFDAQWKIVPPRFPESIGIITSATAAAYTDILRRFNERWGGLTVALASVPVQGPRAPREMAAAIKYFNETYPVDVIILTRGGGSLEDLQAFNSEPLCRAVFASKIPVISGIGHERDTTLVDFVADVRASTPTNAAECAVPHRREVRNEIIQKEQQISTEMTHMLATRAQILAHALTKLFYALAQQAQDVRGVFARFASVVTQYERWWAARLEGVLARLLALSPQATLRRGYSITRYKGKVIYEATAAGEGDILDTTLAKGRVKSVVAATFNR